MFRHLIVGSLVVLSIGCSFADFQSESQKCINFNVPVPVLGDTPIYMNNCHEKVRNKYIVKKSTACKMSDGLYTLPLDTKRPSKKVFNTEFYKFNNIVYYPIRIYTANEYDYEYYLYSYNCKTKKTVALTSDNSFLIDIVQGHKEKLFIQKIMPDTDGWVTNSVVNMGNRTSIIEFSLSSLQGYAAYHELLKTKIIDIFNTTDSLLMGVEDEMRPSKKGGGMLKKFDVNNYIACPYLMCSPSLSIENVNSKLIGDIVFTSYLGEPFKEIKLKLAKVNLYNNTITLTTGTNNTGSIEPSINIISPISTPIWIHEGIINIRFTANTTGTYNVNLVDTKENRALSIGTYTYTSAQIKDEITLKTTYNEYGTWWLNGATLTPTNVIDKSDPHYNRYVIEICTQNICKQSSKFSIFMF